MTATLQTFDPGLINLVVGGNPITGFAPGSFVTVEREEDTYTLVVGAGGETARTRNRNKSGKMTITLMQTAPSNDVLSALHNTDELTGVPAGASMLKDMLGTTILGGDESFVSKPAATKFGKEADTREWVIVVPRLDGVTGGAL